MERRIEGFEVDQYFAQFKGKRIEVSTGDDTQIGLDRVVVMLVTVRSTGVTHEILESGDVRQVRKFDVSDIMPLSGAAREQAIGLLSGHRDPNQDPLWETSKVGPFPVPPTGVDPDGVIEEPSEPVRVLSPAGTAASSLPASSRSNNGHDERPLNAQDPEDLPGHDPDEHPPSPSGPDRDGPEIIGSVYPADHSRDPRLARFLQEEL